MIKICANLVLCAHFSESRSSHGLHLTNTRVLAFMQNGISGFSPNWEEFMLAEQCDSEHLKTFALVKSVNEEGL